MLTRVLLSVKPRFAEAILTGKKTFEFRRALFRRPGVRKVVLYASSPVCRVVGEFHLDDIITLDLDRLWVVTRHGGGIDRSYFDRYFAGRTTGHALKVRRPRRYRRSLCLHADFGVARAPQSFMYLE